MEPFIGQQVSPSPTTPPHHPSPSPSLLPDIQGVVKSGLKTLSSALEITSDNVVRLRGCSHVTCNNPALVSHDLSTVNQIQLDSSQIDSILTTGTLYLLLVHYRNHLIHLFVPEAMLAICLPDDDTVHIGKCS